MKITRQTNETVEDGKRGNYSSVVAQMAAV